MEFGHFQSRWQIEWLQWCYPWQCIQEFKVWRSHFVPVCVWHRGKRLIWGFLAEEDWTIITHQQYYILVFSSYFLVEQQLYFVSPAECVWDCPHECLMYYYCFISGFNSVLFSSICLSHFAPYQSHAPNRWLKYFFFFLKGRGCALCAASPYRPEIAVHTVFKSKDTNPW